MRIITVSRQFGSGGRELGKRLSDLLGFDYYDREIIEALALKQGMDPETVRRELGSHGWHHYQMTFRNSFHQSVAGVPGQTGMLLAQREILLEIAEAGNDCVIVGRDADVVLHENHPFRICVCADMQSRLERCLRHEEKKPPEERVPEKEILRNIRRIDRNRRRTREILTGESAVDGSGFDLTVNASGWEIK
jgi:cytidylate kinase